MTLVNKSLRKQAALAIKKPGSDHAAKDHKRAVTLYLDRANFEDFQKLYGRKTSQAVDELIEAVVGEQREKLRAV